MFKYIKNYEGLYEINKEGAIRSLVYRGRSRGNIFLYNRVLNLKYCKARSGYPYVDLFDGAKRKRFYVHRLVAEAFLENPENKPFVNHKDFNKENYHVDNLEWVTPSENCQHALNNNIGYMKERHKNCKLSEEDVVLIKSSSEKTKVLAEKFNVTPRHIRAIRSGEERKRG